jgi:SAM-dependent methyltransferase
MVADDHTKWNERYRTEGRGTQEPAPFLLSLAGLLPARGRALDVAGGTGRNSLWLARRGLDVTLVDISDVALALARNAAESWGLSLRTECLDLETGPFPPGPWDVILCIHFLSRRLYESASGLLAKAGLLIIEQPTRSNLRRHSRPSARYVLEDGELPRLVPDLEVLQCEEGWFDGGQHTARLVARRSHTGAQ